MDKQILINTTRKNPPPHPGGVSWKDNCWRLFTTHPHPALPLPSPGARRRLLSLTAAAVRSFCLVSRVRRLGRSMHAASSSPSLPTTYPVGHRPPTPSLSARFAPPIHPKNGRAGVTSSPPSLRSYSLRSYTRPPSPLVLPSPFLLLLLSIIKLKYLKEIIYHGY